MPAVDASPGGAGRPRVMFIYPSLPTTIASTIEIAISRLKLVSRGVDWFSWREITSEGSIIPATVLREIGTCTAIIADMTSMNLNVSFELGIAIGLGVPVVPIRDVSYETRDGGGSYQALGFIDAMGCIDFRNSSDLVQRLAARPLDIRAPAMTVDHPWSPQAVAGGPAPARHVLTVHGAFETEGVHQVAMALERAQIEAEAVSTASMGSLVESLPLMVRAAAGVIVHLMDPGRRGVIGLLEPNRRGVSAENARGVFIAGVAHGAGVPLILLQEGYEKPPVDFGRLVRSYADPSRIPQLLEEFLASVIEHFVLDRGDRATLVRLSRGSTEPTAPATDDLRDVLAAFLRTSRAGLDDTWLRICVPLVEGQASQTYMLSRIPGNSEDLAHFLRMAASEGLARRRDRINRSDILYAESRLSEVLLTRIEQKLGAARGRGSPLRQALSGIGEIVPASELVTRLSGAGIDAAEAADTISLLFGDGAIGVWDPHTEKASFSRDSSDPVQVIDDDVLLTISPSLHTVLRVRPHARGSLWPRVWSVG
jgi:hypothetical protein